MTLPSGRQATQAEEKAFIELYFMIHKMANAILFKMKIVPTELQLEIIIDKSVKSAEKHFESLFYRDGYESWISTWCYNMVRNKITDHHRKESRLTGLEEAYYMEDKTCAEQTCDANFFMEYAERKSREAKDKQVYVMFLMNLQGWKCKEIAEQMDKPLNTVVTYTRRARINIQKEFRIAS